MNENIKRQILDAVEAIERGETTELELATYGLLGKIGQLALQILPEAEGEK